MVYKASDEDTLETAYKELGKFLTSLNLPVSDVIVTLK